MKHKHPILALITCSAIGLGTFLIFNPIANRYRTAPGIGGEMFFLLLPHFIWFFGIPTIQEMLQMADELLHNTEDNT